MGNEANTKVVKGFRHKGDVSDSKLKRRCAFAHEKRLRNNKKKK